MLMIDYIFKLVIHILKENYRIGIDPYENAI